QEKKAIQFREFLAASRGDIAGLPADAFKPSGAPVWCEVSHGSHSRKFQRRLRALSMNWNEHKYRGSPYRYLHRHLAQRSLMKESTLMNNEGFATSQDIAISLIIPGPNTRKKFDQVALEELAANIKEHSVLQPVLVRPRSVSAEDLKKPGEHNFKVGD